MASLDAGGDPPPASPGAPVAAAAPEAAAGARWPLPFRLLPTHPTVWDPLEVAPALNACLDGCIVPSPASPDGARVSFSSVVVLDGLIDEASRAALLDLLTAPGGGEQEEGSAGEEEQVAACAAGDPALPPGKWERRTADAAGGAATWGARDGLLAELEAGLAPALREVGARLAALYPQADIAHLPSDLIQPPPAAAAASPEEEESEGAGGEESEGVGGEENKGAGGEQLQQRRRAAKRRRRAAPAPPFSVRCAAFVANAAQAGDSFAWHVDADPTSFPADSPWAAAYGDYFNGEPGRPLLVSLLVYLNDAWQADWGGETLFLDGASGVGLAVCPRPGRAVLFHQDVSHRLCAPSAAAGGRRRVSLVWKLALLPRVPGGVLALARPEWGPPAPVGSAARVGAVLRQLAAERRGAGGAPAGGSAPS